MPTRDELGEAGHAAARTSADGTGKPPSGGALTALAWHGGWISRRWAAAGASRNDRADQSGGPDSGSRKGGPHRRFHKRQGAERPRHR